MKVEFTNRAVGDLRKISTQSCKEFGDRVAAALELRIRNVVEQIGNAPESAARVEQRPGMRVLPLVRYPSKSSTELSETRSESCMSDTRRDSRGRRVGG
jgi:plasmid stabilization system protein ParE